MMGVFSVLAEIVGSGVDSDGNVHTIYDANLKGGAYLHRFGNHSAIYLDHLEEFRCNRNREESMIRKWNSRF